MTVIFYVYGSILIFPAVYEREMDTQKLTKQNASEAKLEALITKINIKALHQIFLDSLGDARYGEVNASIGNSFAEGTGMYPPDAADTLTRVHN